MVASGAALVAYGLLPRAVRAELVRVLPRIKPSIVAVGTWQAARNPAFRFHGTGFAIGDGRLIATNAHVVAQDPTPGSLESWAVVVTDGGRSTLRQATRLTLNKDHDLAILRVDGAPLPALVLADGDLVNEGQSIAFTGFPIGSVLGFSPVTHRGIVSAITPIGIPQANAHQLDSRLIHRLGGDVFEVYQLDATAYPGNSGSPMFHPDSGKVLGVINMVFVKGTKESVLSDPSGISYAIPVRYLKAMLDALG